MKKEIGKISKKEHSYNGIRLYFTALIMLKKVLLTSPTLNLIYDRILYSNNICCEQIVSEVISLPVHPGLSIEDIEKIILSIKKRAINS